MKNVYIKSMVDRKLKKKLELYAMEDNRSLSNYVEDKENGNDRKNKKKVNFFRL